MPQDSFGLSGSYEETVLAPGIRATTQNTRDFTNRGAKGLILVIDMTVVPGVDTVTFTIQGKSSLSGIYYPILASAALVAAAPIVLRVFPALTPAANLVANDVLPPLWRVNIVHSAATNFTYSLNAIYLRP